MGRQIAIEIQSFEKIRLDNYFYIDDFYKVCSYAGFFKANSGSINEINYNEITITLISYSNPREMIKLLKKEKRYQIREKEQGIYYIGGGMFPAQLIVTRLLPEEERKLYNLG